MYAPVFQHQAGPGQGKANASSLWIQGPQLSVHIILSGYTDAPRLVGHFTVCVMGGGSEI